MHVTPVLTSTRLSAAAETEVFFKCEGFQRSGAFKARGAVNAVLSTDAVHIATHSSGNHGAAVAYAAQALGREATVVVPEGASAFKLANIERYGANIVGCGPTLAEREAALSEVVARTGAAVVHPYDDDHVILGQGSMALELVTQVPDLESIWLPVGGGGLAAGSVIAVADQCAIVGAEPELAGDAAIGLANGVREPQMPPRTVADGLRTSLGERNFKVLHNYGLPVHLVSEAEIIAAQRLVMSCLKVLVEPSSAVPFAALLKARPGGRVAVVLTGANLLNPEEEVGG